MRKLLWILAGVVVVVLGGALALPGLLDWNQYKGMATEKVRELTGRELTIAGDVSIAIWPAPALVAEDITFTSLPGSQSPNLASVKAVEVRVALAPLLSGRVQVETVKLIEPVIELERLADGRANWEFTPATAANDNKPTGGASSGGGESAEAAPDVVLDNFAIENGTLIYRDTAAGLIEPIEKLNATISAASLRGPMDSSGSLVLRGIPLSYSASLGEIIHDRTVPFNARLNLAAGDLSVQAGGSLVNLLNAPQFKGNVRIEGEDLSASLAGLGLGAPGGSAPLPLKLSGQVVASAKAAEIKGLSIDLAGIQAEGDLQADLGDKLRFGTQLGINRLDVDKLMARLNAKPAAKAATDAKPAAATASKEAAPPKPAPVAAGPVRFQLPANVAGNAILTVDAIGYKGGVIRDLVVNAEMADGMVSLQQFSGQFPGGSDFTISGRLSTPEAVPTFAGDVESTVSDLRGVLSWLEVAPPPVPADRLRKLALKSQFVATPEQVQVSGVDMAFDSSRLTGGVTVAVRDRLGFGAALLLDRINVDAYLPAEAKASAPKAKTEPGSAGAAPSAAAQPQAKPANPLSALGALATFDANFNLQVTSAVYQGTPVQDLVAEGTLYNGALDLKRLSVGKLAGASANIAGKLKGLSEIPAAENLRISAKVPDLSALARVAGATLPLDGKKLGAISLKSRVDGSLLAPTVDATTGIAGAVASYKGRVSWISLGDLLSGRLAIKHNDLPTLLNRLGVEYKPAGKLGGIDLAADIKGGTDAITLSGLKGAIGKTAIGGTLAAQLAGAKPKINADLRTGALNIEDFLPAQKSAQWQGLVPTLIPAAWSPQHGRQNNPSPLLHKTARGQWPTEPLDLSVLGSFDADVALKAPVIIYGRYLAEQADIGAKIAGGVLNVERLTGEIFGGALTGTARVDQNGNQVQSALKVTGINVEEALQAVTGEAAANGKMDVAFDVASAGKSVAALVQSLGGKGNFQLSGMDVQKATQGSLLSGLLGLFTSLNQLGGKAEDDKASVGATFDIQRGIATTKDLQLASAYGNGGAAGTIDLPNWTIDLKGQVKLAESTLMRILKAKVRETSNAVPFAITGSLEAPNVKVDTNAALGAGVPLPGANTILNKAPKGVGNFLKGILGGGASSSTGSDTPPPATSGGQEPPAATPPPPPSSSQPAEDPAQKLLQKLFKKL